MQGAINYLRESGYICNHYKGDCKECPLGNKVFIKDCRCPHLLRPMDWTDEITTEMVREVSRIYEEVKHGR